jgi:hypothetical protein
MKDELKKMLLGPQLNDLEQRILKMTQETEATKTTDSSGKKMMEELQNSEGFQSIKQRLTQDTNNFLQWSALENKATNDRIDKKLDALEDALEQAKAQASPDSKELFSTLKDILINNK